MKFAMSPYTPMAALLFAAYLATGCSERTEEPIPVVPQAAATASDVSSQPSLVGTLPVDTNRDTPATTSAEKSNVSKVQQSNDMPMPGQANDHSTLAPNASQKANTKSRQE
jgi:PBP1b-binding outer membrane lipoprotein LpoB